MTVAELLELRAEDREQGLRFVDSSESTRWLPWSEVHARALRVAGRLGAAGVGAGDRVALVFPTCPAFFDAFFGALVAGAVPVPLYPPVRLGRLDEYHRRTAAMLSAAGARLVLADRRVRRLLGQAVAPARPLLGCRTLDELPEGPPARIGRSPDDLALVQFSSGTTFDPKPVALSHRAVLSQTAALNRIWPQPAGGTVDSGVSWLPLYHDMGLIGCVLPALAAPGTLTLLPPEAFVARPALWLRAVSRFRATISPAPCFAYGLCVAKIRDEELDGVDLSSWRIALNGAEPVVGSVMRAFAERFERWGFRREALTPVYGLSEAALAVTFSDIDRLFVSRRFDRDALARSGRAVPADEGREIVSVGRPLAGFEVRIVALSGGNRPEGREGRILARGPSLMDGYLGRPEATERVMADGWLDTGDLGFLLDGELFLTGRAKDVLILNGRNHAPEDVESAVWSVPGVRAGCAVAVSWLPERSEGERLLLLVEAARGDAECDREEVFRACRTAVRAATGLTVDHVEVLAAGTLPRTSSGKLRRGESLRRWLDGSLDPAGSPSLWRLGLSALRSSLDLARLHARPDGVSDGS